MSVMPRLRAPWLLLPFAIFMCAQTFLSCPTWRQVARAGKPRPWAVSSTRCAATGNSEEILKDMSPAERIAEIWHGDNFDAIADAIEVPPPSTPSWLEKEIKAAAGYANMYVTKICIAGSHSTGTAVKYSSDLDVNIHTFQPITREKRTIFKHRILPPLGRRGFAFVHMGKKVLQFQLRDGNTRGLDMAFMNTLFDTGVDDRIENVNFFRRSATAQKAVRMFKFGFLGVRGLCGFHCERLAMQFSREATPDPKDLWKK